MARYALAGLSVLMIAGCGTHSNPAPAIYGDSAARSSRVKVAEAPSQGDRYDYSSYGAEQAPLMRAQPAAAVEPVHLTPVSAVYLSEPTPSSASIAPASADPGLVISVQPGDTVYAIARRYELKPDQIIAANNLSAPYALSIGQSLRIPQTAAPERKVVARDRLYSVRKGDTLYSISRNSQTSVAAIAQANRLTAPYDLRVGQQLLIPQAKADPGQFAINRATPSPSSARAASAPSAAPSSDVAQIAQTVSYNKPAPARPDAMFNWPVKGRIIAGFGSGEVGRRNDGVNIAAPAGTPVRAAADGEVVYRGAELDGFGNLLLVKHADGFVTAYAHNDAMLVKKGDSVRQGQVIAKVGQTGSVSSPQLHFEIRQNLKSIDPTALLGEQ